MIFLVGVESFRDVMRFGAEVYYIFKGVIKDKYGKDVINVGDEGGFVFNILENSEGEVRSFIFNFKFYFILGY